MNVKPSKNVRRILVAVVTLAMAGTLLALPQGGQSPEEINLAYPAPGTVTYQPAFTPFPTWTGTPPAMDEVFLPLILKARGFKGLAFADPAYPEDIAALNVGWWYNWGPTGNVPMLWSGSPSSQIPSNYTGAILVLNEPNLSNQSNYHSPADSVAILANLRTAYPQAHLVCCGVSVFADSWMSEFWNLGGRPDSWHVHSYIDESYVTLSYAQNKLTTMHNLTGGDYWITEYNSFTGNAANFAALTDWFYAQSWITHIAAYTNREPSGVSWGLGPQVWLVNSQGALTALGTYYRDKSVYR